jgi:16S rRNA (adenine1518-N6/adenine1519-N6)-dimethyltransferase
MGSLPIQIVDENDHPLRAGTKQEARADGLVHRVVRIMLHHPDGRILLQHRSPTKDIFPDCWDNSAAGHVDADESYNVAAIRELAEELSLADVPLTHIGKYYTDETWQGLYLKRFCCVYTGQITDTPDKLEAGKVDGVRWFTLDEIRHLAHTQPEKCSDGLLQVLERYY